MIDATQWNRYLYAVWAPFYDALVGVLEDKRRRSLQLAQIQPGEKVLLLGAGTGLDLKYLPKNARVTAIDITPGMIKRLQKRAENLDMDVDARVMDGQVLDFADESFDVVVLHFVLAVIPDPSKTIRETNRVLRSGGRAVILNKFVRDDCKPSLLLRIANRITRLIVTDITCKLGPIVAVSGLQPVLEEQMGMGGFFKIAILEKVTATDVQRFEASPAAAPLAAAEMSPSYAPSSSMEVAPAG